MDQRMCFMEHIDGMVGKALAMLGYIRCVSGKCVLYVHGALKA
jgi:hypothetical protein